jgi:hypothetical protein
VALDAAMDRALNNLCALPAPTWEKLVDHVWKLDSKEGYNESFLQLPKVFDTLPARGTPLAMIPSRGVLLASGSDEPGGITALLAAAREYLQEAPWPLSGDLFRISSTGIQLFVPPGSEAQVLGAIERLDTESISAAQKAALEKHCEAVQDDVFVATYGLLSQKDDPNRLQSWCAWTDGVPTLLPKTDKIAFVWNLDRERKTTLVPWEHAATIVGHYFTATSEEPPGFVLMNSRTPTSSPNCRST